MERIINKIILLTLASLVTVSLGTTAGFVATLFVAIALICGTTWMDNNGGKWIVGSLILDAIGLTLAGVMGYLILVPVIAYDLMQNFYAISKTWRYVIAIMGVAGAIVLAMNFNLFIVVLTVVAVYLSFIDCKSEKTRAELLLSKDKSIISQDELKRRNRQIMEERERELYLGTITERNRIAREIHDNVGHMLSRSILMVGAMLTIHKEEPVHEELTQLQDTLNSAMTSIRKSVHDLRDDSVDLNESITDMLKPLKDKFEINLNIDDDEVIPSDIKYAISSICKECISNIIKYSSNDTVSVMINIHPSMYQVEVRDYMASGVSTKSDYAMTEGMGLTNISKRAEDLGGRALITNTNGFRVFVTIPKRK